MMNRKKDQMKIGVLILAGGKSSRMGLDKAALSFGNENFTEHLAKELSNYSELLLSRTNESQEDFGLRSVYDIYPGCGPIGGLHAALTSCVSEALLTVPCDTPLFTAELSRFLCSQISADYDAVVLTDGNRKYPLCAVYKKSALCVLKRHIERNDFRMLSVLDDLKVRYINIEETEYSADCLKNINNWDEYRQLLNT